MKLKNSSKIIGIVITSFFFTLIISKMAYVGYMDYKTTLITQQQQHLLTIAKSISRSLELFVEQKSENLEVLAKNPGFMEEYKDFLSGKEPQSLIKTLDCFYEGNTKDIDGMFLIDLQGNVHYERSIDEDHGGQKKSVGKDPHRAYGFNMEKSHIGKVYSNDQGQYYIDIFEPVFYKNQFLGVLVNSMNLDTMYRKLVSPVKAGKKGYAMVKNRQGVIIMHPVSGQIGIESVKVRKEKYPDFDWSELEDLDKRQIEGKEGTAIYHSLWWQEDILSWSKKLGAFAPAHIGEDYWVVAVQMGYAEIEKPIRENFSNMLAIAIFVVLVVAISLFMILKIKKNKDALETETKYLKELNKTTEALRRSEAQLQHGQKLQTIGTLTGGIAHEFNNLLTPILAYSEIMLEELSPQKTFYDEVKAINGASTKAKELIEQILVFSRSEMIKPVLTSVSINKVVEDTMKMIRSIVSTNIQIVEEIHQDCGYVLASSTQIHQVLLNLWSNAYHAMKENGGTLTVALNNVTKKEDVHLMNMNVEDIPYVKIEVKDTGIGMEEDVLIRIFDPFYTTKTVGEGTGLGLSVVHGIIKNCHGEIFVESKTGVGTTFYIYLPQIQKG